MPSLPSLYLIGDSISIDYHRHLKSLLAEEYVYRRKGGVEKARKNLDKVQGANGGDSACVLAHLREELSAGMPEETIRLHTFVIK